MPKKLKSSLKRTEKKFYQKIRSNNWKAPDFFIQKIDTFATKGIPDLLVKDPENHFHFVELKITETRKVKLSPHQISFFKEHSNTRTWLMVEDKTKSIYLFRAYQILQIAKDGLNVSPFAFFEHPYIDWEKIFNTLLKFK
jgi:Holliday junction resolvase